VSEHRKIKRQHEIAVIENFVAWLNQSSGAHWVIIEHPDPPDAIIKDGEKTSWVEHADLYRHWEEARSETSFVTPGTEHIPHSENPISDPDQRTAMALMSLLQDKLSKDSYSEVHEAYGPGFLLISERDPLFDSNTVAVIDRLSEQIAIADDKGYFARVYLAIRETHRVVYGELTYQTSV